MQDSKLKEYGFGKDLKEIFLYKNIYKFKNLPNKINKKKLKKEK